MVAAGSACGLCHKECPALRVPCFDEYGHRGQAGPHSPWFVITAQTMCLCIFMSSVIARSPSPSPLYENLRGLVHSSDDQISEATDHALFVGSGFDYANNHRSSASRSEVTERYLFAYLAGTSDSKGKCRVAANPSIVKPRSTSRSGVTGVLQH
jgi:hypothetical protein